MADINLDKAISSDTPILYITVKYYSPLGKHTEFTVPRKSIFTPKCIVEKNAANHNCWVNNIHYFTFLELFFL